MINFMVNKLYLKFQTVGKTNKTANFGQSRTSLFLFAGYL